ncbi:translation initiation factor eIF-1A [Nanoarchaeota archaeon]
MAFKKKGKKRSSKFKDESTGMMERVRLPKGIEVLGILEQRLGGSRILVKCFDGKTRNCRVPGRLKRRLWLREGNIVLVEPWEYQGDTKGDVIYKYTKTAAEWLKRRGYIKIEEEF